MKRLFLFLSLAFALQPVARAADSKPTQFDEAAERQVVQLINQSRVTEGLQPLAVDQRLTEAARKHTARMIQHRELSHQYDDEDALPLRFANENFRSDKQAENIALEIDAVSAHNSLMHSPGHRANIMNPAYNAVGVGVVNTGHEIYVTEDFAERMPDYSEHQADAMLQRTIARYAEELRVPAPARKPQKKLHELACQMALNDTLDNSAPLGEPGIHNVLEWTASDLGQLPPKAKDLLSQPQSGYSLGVCYAPSVSHPGGVYWVVMVFY
jgi:uncharacterized protein YkwD